MPLSPSNPRPHSLNRFALTPMAWAVLACVCVFEPNPAQAATCSPDSRLGTCAGAVGTGSATVENAQLLLQDGDSFTEAYGGWARGTGDAQGNVLRMSGGTVTNDVFGGRSNGNAALNNQVLITGGEVANSVYGGFAAGDAKGNSVHIEGGKINAGGESNKNVTGAYSMTGQASGNLMRISGGEINGLISGGYGAAGATANRVVIEGSPIFGAATILAGGLGRGDVRTDNLLEIRTSGLSLKGLESFQHLRFYLPETIRAGATVLTVADAVDLSTPAGQGATTIGVGLVGSATPLNPGDSLTLIQANGGLTTDAGLSNSTTGMAGISTVYEFELANTGNALTATVAGGQASDQAIRQSPAEGRLAGTALLTQGGDLAADQALAEARAATSGRGGFHGFVSLAGGDSRYDSAGRLDLNSAQALFGAATALRLGESQAMAGLFFETGTANYSSINATAAGASVRADGDSRYVGAGLLGRYDFANCGAYLEASLRTGRLKTDYRSGELNAALGVASYDTSVAYWGAHATLGKNWPLGETSQLAVYGRYSYAHTSGADVDLFGDAVAFDAMDSQRLRIGGRYDWTLAPHIRPYADLAWEYEFDGDARSTVAGRAVATTSLEGGSAVGELGLRLAPSADQALSLELGLQGWAGQRDGVAAALRLNYAY